MLGRLGVGAGQKKKRSGNPGLTDDYAVVQWQHIPYVANRIQNIPELRKKFIALLVASLIFEAK